MTAPIELAAQDESTTLARAVDRLHASLRGEAKPGAGERLVKAVASGTPPAEALATCVPAPIATLVRETAPEELGGVLDDVSSAWAKSQRRRARTKSSSGYPVLLALASGVVGAIVLGLTLPAMTHVNAPDTLPLDARPLDTTLPAFAIGLSVVLLLFAAVLWAFDLPVPPFVKARRDRDRALVLSVASALATRGTPLSLALRGAAKLVSGVVRVEAEELAGALERGAVQGVGATLLGPLGASLFAAAAAEGAGPSSLEALAALAEARAEASTPKAAFRAEVLSIVIGGLGVAVAAASFMVAYAGVLGRS